MININLSVKYKNCKLTSSCSFLRKT